MEPTAVPAQRALKVRDLWLEELRVRSSSPLTISSYLAHTDEALRACAKYLEVERDALTLEAITRDSLIAELRPLALLTQREAPAEEVDPYPAGVEVGSETPSLS